MGNYLHRTTKKLHTSISPNNLPGELQDYIESPDMSPVYGVPTKYWKIVGDIITEMTDLEKVAIDEAEIENNRDKTLKEFDSLEGNLRQIIKLLVSEINILRTKAGLAERTLIQVKNAIRSGYGE